MPAYTFPTFYLALDNWFQTLTSEFSKLSTSYATIAITTKEFSKYLEKKIGADLISKQLKAEWLATTNSLGDTTNGKILFDRLINSNAPMWQVVQDEKKLKQHYQKNESFYKELDVSFTELSENILPQLALFQEALDASTTEKPRVSIDDISNIERFKQFQNEYSHWLLQQKNILLNNNDTTLKGAIVDCSKLIKSRNSLHSPDYMKVFLSNLVDDIIQQIEGEKFVTIERASSISTRVLDKNSTTSQQEELFALHLKTQETGFPSGLANWLAGACVRIDFASLEAAMSDWSNDVAGAIDNFVANKMNSRVVKMNRKLVLKNFKTLFAKTLIDSNATPALAIYAELVNNLPQKNTFYSTELQESWRLTMASCQKTSFIDQLYFDYIIKDFTNIGRMEAAMRSFDNTLPSKDAIVSACKQSRYFAPKIEGDTKIQFVGLK